jgi:Fe-S cluster biogenesis protein NfuA
MIKTFFDMMEGSVVKSIEFQGLCSGCEIAKAIRYYLRHGYQTP